MARLRFSPVGGIRKPTRLASFFPGRSFFGPGNSNQCRSLISYGLTGQAHVFFVPCRRLLSISPYRDFQAGPCFHPIERLIQGYPSRFQIGLHRCVLRNSTKIKETPNAGDGVFAPSDSPIALLRSVVFARPIRLAANRLSRSRRLTAFRSPTS